VTLTVRPINDAPIAAARSATTWEDTPAVIALTAIDHDDDPLTYSVVSPPSHGILAVGVGSVTYVPDVDFNGNDSFTWKAHDPMLLESNTAIVSLIVLPVNDAPVAADIVAGT